MAHFVFTTRILGSTYAFLCFAYVPFEGVSVPSSRVWKFIYCCNITLNVNKSAQCQLTIFAMFFLPYFSDENLHILCWLHNKSQISNILFMTPSPRGILTLAILASKNVHSLLKSKIYFWLLKWKIQQLHVTGYQKCSLATLKKSGSQMTTRISTTKSIPVLGVDQFGPNFV